MPALRGVQARGYGPLCSGEMNYIYVRWGETNYIYIRCLSFCLHDLGDIHQKSLLLPSNTYSQARAAHNLNIVRSVPMTDST